ncbi:MAG: hypothetical protein ACI915_005068 [Gammaproteobacteria bacterium]|jgi:hypothetical protein
MNRIEPILELARWAPSGDNTQPWRFEIVDERHVIIHGFDTRSHCVYDLRGRASQLSIGVLLQTIKIAATKYQLRCEISRQTSAPEIAPCFDVRFVDDSNAVPDALVDSIEKRATQRRPMNWRSLSPSDKQQLSDAAGPNYSIEWWTLPAEKFRIARLLLKNARLRLITPEAFEVHRSVIEWNAQFSETRIPDRALGLDPVGLRLTQWAMQDWTRMNLINSIPGGTLVSRLQLDFIPSLFCSGHFALIATKRPETIDDFIDAGMAVQRVWLQLTALERWMQPEMTPLIFSGYLHDKIDFTVQDRAVSLATALKNEFEGIVGKSKCERAVWMGRIGSSNGPQSRSIRQPLSALQTKR